MDYDTYSANDAIGKVYIDLNPLLCKEAGSLLSGWFPIYDTMHGSKLSLKIVNVQFYKIILVFSFIKLFKKNYVYLGMFMCNFLIKCLNFVLLLFEKVYFYGRLNVTNIFYYTVIISFLSLYLSPLYLNFYKSMSMSIKFGYVVELDRSIYNYNNNNTHHIVHIFFT